jgi:hypothetical protein
MTSQLSDISQHLAGIVEQSKNTVETLGEQIAISNILQTFNFDLFALQSSHPRQ